MTVVSSTRQDFRECESTSDKDNLLIATGLAFACRPAQMVTAEPAVILRGRLEEIRKLLRGGDPLPKTRQESDIRSKLNRRNKDIKFASLLELLDRNFSG